MDWVKANFAGEDFEVAARVGKRNEAIRLPMKLLGPLINELKATAEVADALGVKR